MRHFQRITMNLIGADTSYKTMDGKQYLVVPTVMLTEGVHAGSEGPLLYLSEHIGKNPSAWNHKPAVVYHPMQNGLGVSACNPDIIERQGVGLLMNTVFDTKLRSESWLDEAKTDRVDSRILPAIRNKQILNGSTGLWHDLKAEPGKWNETPYTGLVCNILPDHWAILPDMPGACKDAGLLRNDAVEGVSYDDIRQQIYMAVKADAQNQSAFSNGYVYCYVSDVYQKYAIVEINDIAYAIPYSIKDGVVKIGSDYQQVRRVNSWLTVNTSELLTNFAVSILPSQNSAGNITPKTVQTNQEPTMSQVNTTTNTPSILTPAQALTQAAGVVVPAQAAAPAAPAIQPGSVEALVQAQASQVQNNASVEQYVASMPPAIQSLIRNALQAQEQQKQALIQVITNNKANRFTPDWLKTQNTEVLYGIACLAGGMQNPTNNFAPQAEIPVLLPFSTNAASGAGAHDQPALGTPSVLTAAV